MDSCTSASAVLLGFLEAAVGLGFPALGKFLERAYIHVAVVKESFETWHVARQKAPILPNAVAAQRHLALGT